MKHVICYEGKVGVALGLMQEAYVPLFLPWINWRIGIEGTLQRPPYSLAQGIDWVRGFDKTKGSNEVFAVLQRVPSKKKLAFRYVGHMGIHNVQWPHGFATTGSIIGSTTAQGKGLGTEAKLLLLYHAFMILGVQKIISNVKAFNAQSAGHLLKCGYKPVGRYRRHHLHEGQRVDEILFEVFREDWEPIWQAYQANGTLPKLSGEQRSFIQTEMTT
jgi:RimJ/RimL family protein N-acetyltransferase